MLEIYIFYKIILYSQRTILALHWARPNLLTAWTQYTDSSISLTSWIVKVDIPDSELYSNWCEWSGIISSFALYHFNMGTGLPVTAHLSSSTSLTFATHGFNGSVNCGASPVSSFSKK